MKIGVPKEVKNNEFRVGMLPWMVKELTTQGHEVLVESNAGVGAGYTNAAYQEVGGIVVDAAIEVWGQADMIVKVKEPIASEYPLIKENHILCFEILALG